jgi:histidine triad (HIT) family protein
VTALDCVFCDIVAGTAQASFVHRGDRVSAFLDIRPVTPGHLLVVPNDHVDELDSQAQQIRAHVQA